MNEGQAYQRDLLDDRGWIDRWGFLLFAFGGAAAILIAKTVGVHPIPVAAGAAISMVAYAFVVQTSGTGRLRADQAGDNCYYLGLIYTLISLSYAIFFFDPATTATTVVSGFGVALATTIMGLVLRVFFNQSRVDLVETEDTARIELAAAAGRLKAELQAMTVSMSDYGRETRQALDELRGQVVSALVEVKDETTKVIYDASSTASAAIVAITAQATNAVTQQSDDALSRSRKMTSATDKVIGSIERHAAAMDGIESSSTAIAASLTSLDGAAHRTQQTLGTLAVRAEELSSVQATIYLGPSGYGIVTELSIMNQRLPDTLITALPGRSLRYVIGYDGTPAFFASRFTTIVDAEMSDLPLGDELQLILSIKWHPLSRVLPHLG